MTLGVSTEANPSVASKTRDKRSDVCANHSPALFKVTSHRIRPPTPSHTQTQSSLQLINPQKNQARWVEKVRVSFVDSLRRDDTLTSCQGWLFLFAVLMAAVLLFTMVFFVSLGSSTGPN